MNKSTLAMIFLIMFLISWVFLLRPTTLGGSAAYIIISGKSMQPTIQSGDLALTRAQPSYRIGDIVAFREQGGIVLHRIISGTMQSGFATRGDGNGQNDPWTVTSDAMLGRLWLQIPSGGKFLLNVMGALRQPLYLGGLGASLLVLFLATGDVFTRHRRTRSEIIIERRRRRRHYKVKGWNTR